MIYFYYIRSANKGSFHTFSTSRTFCTNHKSIDPTSSQMHRYKNSDTFCTFYLNCFRLDCSMLPPIGSMLLLLYAVAMDPAGINSTEDRHVSTNTECIRNFIRPFSDAFSVKHCA